MPWTNSIYRVTILPGTTGTYRLQVNGGDWSDPIPYDATALEVANAILVPEIQVTGDYPDPAVIEFVGELAGTYVGLNTDGSGLNPPDQWSVTELQIGGEWVGPVTQPLTFRCLTDLVASLVAADVRASLDPSDLNLPAAWVTCEGVLAQNLARDYQVQAAVYLIVGDRDYARSLAALAALFNQVVPGVLIPDGPVIAQGVVLPGDPTPLPALRVPVILNETETE